MFWPTNPTTHATTHTTTHHTKHPPMGVEVSRDSKSSNRIEISQFVQVLLRFYWFGGISPWGWVDGWLGVGLGGGTPDTRVHVHTHACMCAHTCMHVKHDKHGCLHGGGHLQFPNMFILAFHACACMCMHACACKHVWGYSPCPQMPLNPSVPSREPQGATGSPNHQKSWTNQDNSILFEKSLPLNIPELI